MSTHPNARPSLATKGPGADGSDPIVAATPQPLLVDRHAAAAMLGISWRQVERLRAGGKLKGKMLGRLRRYAIADLQAFIDDLPERRVLR